MIVVENLTKRYGDHYAIKDLTFTVEKGKIYGFLGPNGAGKSTTMNILTGCLAATDGTAKVDGFDILENPIEAKQKIGYLPEIPPVYVDRTVKEYLRFVTELKKVSKKEREAEVLRVMDAVKITHFENRLIKHLSKGYRQRVGIAEALVGSPEVIILDEPTVGLDPQQIIEIRELIASLRENHTVILSSHILSEVQAVCDTIIVINHGRIVALDTPENLEKEFVSRAEMNLTLEATEEEARALLTETFSEEEVISVTADGDDVQVLLSVRADEPKTVAKKLFFAASEKRIPILRMNTRKASLEDIFIELTKEDPVKPETTEAAPAEETAEETPSEEPTEGGNV